MQDPKPNLSLAALKCNHAYWEAIAEQKMVQLEVASQKLMTLTGQIISKMVEETNRKD